MGYKIAINTMELTGKLPQGDPRWGKFNDSFVNRELEIFDIANDIFMGRSFSPWHTGRRSVENFQLAQHIGVDMDTEDERSSIDYIKAMDFVSIYGGLIYTTPNHTPEKPRARILFFLDQPITDREAYKSAIGFVYGLFPDPDTACIDCSRFFYGSKNCEIALLDNVLPLAHLRNYYKRFKNVIKPVTTQQQAQPPAETRTPYTPKTTTEKEIADALQKIDPWSVDYQKWVAILAALHDELGPAGLSLATSWAQGNPGEVERKWKTFGRYTGKRATLASIFGLAKTH